MFEDGHPDFIDQPAVDASIWRYFDLAKYVSMLNDAALHFARADQMTDPWEGAFGPFNRAMRPQLYGESYAEMEPTFGYLRQHIRQSIHMSCWNLSDEESAAMWDLYVRDGRGVAIRSTWGDLTSSITADRSVYGAKVRYVDYHNEFIPENSMFGPMLCKRKSFAHEREVRLLMLTGKSAPHPTEAGATISAGPDDPVIAVGVDLRRLVNDVFVAPTAASWVVDVVRAVTIKFGYDFNVSHSNLFDDPVD